MNLSSPVCRTCLGIISEGKIGYNVDEENGLIRNVRNIREMIMFCVPEMDVYISVSPTICETCLGILVNVYNFKIRCMRVENAIRSYIVANNVMEGSCVDLSNVVRQQILEALKQKNWPPDVIREYIGKVNKCLNLPRKKPGLPVPPEVFNPISQSINGHGMPPNIPPLGNVHPNFLRPPVSAAPVSNTIALPSNLPENNPVLNTLLEGPSISSTGPSPPPTYEQALREVSHQSPPNATKYLTVSKNLMPEKHISLPCSQQLKDLNSHNTTSIPTVRVAPNLTRQGPPMLPVAPPAPVVDTFQNSFLSTLNLISTANRGREEAVFVRRPESRRRTVNNPNLQMPTNLQIPTNLQMPTNPPNVSLLGKRNSASARNSNNYTEELCPQTGIMRKIRAQKPKNPGIRSVRKYLGPKSKRKEENTVEKDVIILEDSPSVSTGRIDNEVLIMNFDESDNILPENSTADLATKESPESPGVEDPTTDDTPDFSKKMVINLPTIDRETLKRKLSDENVIEEILSKRKKLQVKLNSSLPYLHKHKRLIVKLRNDKFTKCMFCCFTTIDPKDLEMHHLYWHKICKLCNYKCDRKTVLDAHINNEHQTALKDILKRYEGDKTEFSCYLCKFVGLSSFDLRDHRIRIHIKCDLHGMYKCPFPSCDEEDPIAYTIARHVEKQHDSPKRKECPLCNYRSPSLANLKLHAFSHSSSNNVQCPMCSCVSKTAFSLQRHMKRVHGNVEIDQNITGMVYASTPGQLKNLTTDKEGRITLDSATTSTQEPEPQASEPVDETCGFDFLSEMLCTQTFYEIPEQEDDCTIVEEAAKDKDNPSKRRKSVIVNKHNKKSKETVTPDDPDDCMIIEGERVIIDLIDDDVNPSNDDDPSQASKRLQTDSTSATKTSDVIEIVDEECSSVPQILDVQNREEDSETDTCSEISSGQKITPQGAVSGSEAETCSEVSISDILGKQNPATENVEPEKRIGVAEESCSSQSSAKSTDKECATSKDKIAHEKDNEMNNDVEKSVCITEQENISNSSDSNKGTEEGANDTLGKVLESSGTDKVSLVLSDSDQISTEEEILGSSSCMLESLLNERFSDKDIASSMTPKQNSALAVCSESVLIESSDEDTNDCAIVSPAIPEVNVDDVGSKDIEKTLEVDMTTDDPLLSKSYTDKDETELESSLNESYPREKEQENTKESEQSVEQSGTRNGKHLVPEENSVGVAPNCSKQTDEPTSSNSSVVPSENSELKEALSEAKERTYDQLETQQKKISTLNDKVSTSEQDQSLEKKPKEPVNVLSNSDPLRIFDTDKSHLGKGDEITCSSLLTAESDKSPLSAERHLSGNGIIISDSEADNPEVIKKRSDVEVTENTTEGNSLNIEDSQSSTVGYTVTPESNSSNIKDIEQLSPENVAVPITVLKENRVEDDNQVETSLTDQNPPESCKTRDKSLGVTEMLDSMAKSGNASLDSEKQSEVVIDQKRSNNDVIPEIESCKMSGIKETLNLTTNSDNAPLDSEKQSEPKVIGQKESDYDVIPEIVMDNVVVEIDEICKELLEDNSKAFGTFPVLETNLSSDDTNKNKESLYSENKDLVVEANKEKDSSSKCVLTVSDLELKSKNIESCKMSDNSSGIRESLDSTTKSENAPLDSEKQSERKVIDQKRSDNDVVSENCLSNMDGEETNQTAALNIENIIEADNIDRTLLELEAVLRDNDFILENIEKGESSKNNDSGETPLENTLELERRCETVNSSQEDVPCIETENSQMKIQQTENPTLETIFESDSGQSKVDGAQLHAS